MCHVCDETGVRVLNNEEMDALAKRYGGVHIGLNPHGRWLYVEDKWGDASIVLRLDVVDPRWVEIRHG